MAYRRMACESAKWDFILDTDEDVKDLPECGCGSMAISVASGNVFMKNASGQWKLFGGGE